jgi:hypothetical protein
MVASLFFINTIQLGNLESQRQIKRQPRISLPPSLLPKGEVFRTNCSTTNTTFWRMFRGGIERFNICNPANTNDAILRVVQPNGNLLVQTTQRDSTNKTVITSTSDQTIIHNQLILKASDSEEYFLLTINSKGEIKTEKISFSGR